MKDDGTNTRTHDGTNTRWHEYTMARTHEGTTTRRHDDTTTDMDKIKSHKDLKVYQLAYEAALEIHEITKSFPIEEKYSLTDQMRRSSRAVCSNIAEAWRKRRYPKNFISKLSDSESESGETQVWLDMSESFKYIDTKTHDDLYDKYEHILAMLINMSNQPGKWTL